MSWKSFTEDVPDDPIEVEVVPSGVPGLVYVVQGILPVIVNRTEYKPGQEITSTIPEAQLEFLLSGGHLRAKE